MNLLSKLLNNGKKNTSYKILDSDKTNEDRSTWLDETIEKKIDGFIIRNVLSNDLIVQTTNQFNEVPDDIKVLLPNGEGAVYPLPYSMAHSESLTKKYFSSVKAAKPYIQKKLSICPQHFVRDNLSKYTQKKIEIIPNMDDHEFSGLNLRKLKPDSTGISIHCENSFLHQLNPPFREHLENKLELFNQLSFFFVVKKNDESGDIVLYDKEWDNFKVKHENFTDKEQKSDDLVFFKLNNAKNVQSQNVKLQSGDLFIFRAGQIWHRVKNIKNCGDRITMGGFLSKSKKNDSIYFWA